MSSSPLPLPYQSRRYYFLSEEADEGDELRQRCLDLERQVGPRWGDHSSSQGRVAYIAPLLAPAHCTSYLQLVLLSEEKQSLAQENAVLRQRVGQPEGEGATGLTAKKLLLLQSQLEQLQEENFRCVQLGLGPGQPGDWDRAAPSFVDSQTPARLESGREDDRLHCAELEREVTELQQRNQALTSLAQEAQALKDEMDDLR